MGMAYLVVTIVAAAMAAFSGLGKLRRDPKIVHIVHEVIGVPMRYFPHLAACECAGALGWFLGSGGHSWGWLRALGWSFTLWGRLCRTSAWAM
jgi:hypothetical protein